MTSQLIERTTKQKKKQQQQQNKTNQQNQFHVLRLKMYKTSIWNYVYTNYDNMISGL